MPRNNTLQNILGLEETVRGIESTDDVIVSIFADNMDELKSAASDLKCRVFQPFENESNENYYFEYLLDRKHGSKIIVKSKEVYRLSSQIVEV